MLDWANDDLPYAFTTPAGAIMNLPLNHELSDRQIITVQQQSADSYATQITGWVSVWLKSRGDDATGAGCFPLHLTPVHHRASLPHQRACEDLLGPARRKKGHGSRRSGAVVDATARQSSYDRSRNNFLSTSHPEIGLAFYVPPVETGQLELMEKGVPIRSLSRGIAVLQADQPRQRPIHDGDRPLVRSSLSRRLAASCRRCCTKDWSSGNRFENDIGPPHLVQALAHGLPRRCTRSSE